VPYRRVLQKADTKVEGEVQEIDWMKVRGGDESENIPMSTDTWERKEGRKDWNIF
jgi:ribosomal protein S6E (S10)